MYYTIYQITNNINGKTYIGLHKTDDLEDGYMGSGKHLKDSMRYHGEKNFTKEYIHIFDNEYEMYETEAELVNEEYVSRKDTYNLKIGGEGGWDHINSQAETRMEKNRKAARIANERGASEKGAARLKELSKDPEWNRRRTDKIVETTRRNHGDMAFKHMLGKNHSEESKRKISETRRANKVGHGSTNSQYGLMWVNNGTENKQIPREEFLSCDDKWVKGKFKIECDNCGKAVSPSHLNVHKKSCTI